MATYWENSCSFGLRYVSWYKCLIVGLVFSRLGFWSGNLFLIAPFPDLCLLVPSNICSLMRRIMRKQCFTYAKIKVQISFVITAKLISPYFFTTWIVQFYFLCPKLPASSHLLWLYSPWLLSDLGRNHNIGFLLTRLNCVS